MTEATWRWPLSKDIWKGAEDEDVDSIASPSVSGRSDNEDASEIQKDNEELRYDAVIGF